MNDTPRARPAWVTPALWASAALILVVAGWAIISAMRSISNEQQTENVTATATSTAEATSSTTPAVVAAVQPPNATQRCSQDYLTRRFGDDVVIGGCEPEYAELTVPDGLSGLYKWSGYRWEYFADPYEGMCRDELVGQGVPESVVSSFPPCQVAPPVEPPTVEPETPPAPPEPQYEVRGPIGAGTPGGGSDTLLDAPAGDPVAPAPPAG